MMPALCHLNCGLPRPAAGIENAQRPGAARRQQAVKILPEDCLAQLALRGAIDIARKLFRDVIKIAILHNGSAWLRQ